MTNEQEDLIDSFVTFAVHSESLITALVKTGLEADDPEEVAQKVRMMETCKERLAEVVAVYAGAIKTLNHHHGRCLGRAEERKERDDD